MKIRPEVYFDLEIYSDYSTLFTLFTLSINRIGFYLRSSSFRMGIYTHMMFFNQRISISQAYLQFALLIGCDIEDTALYPLADHIFSDKKIEKKYIVINPNASELRLERRWEKDNFIELIRLILNNFQNFEILLIGNKSEYLYTEEISSAINDTRVKNTAGTLTIDELISIIANANIMVSNDTGPMHIAFCTNTPIICLFGPCSPEQYGLSENAHIIYKQVYCSPCVHDFIIPPCKGDNVCMKLISPDEVFTSLKQLLEGSSNINTIEKQKYIYKNGNNILGKVIR
jgi:ADP-heptose:LPS heptosyltransferase